MEKPIRIFRISSNLDQFAWIDAGSKFYVPQKIIPLNSGWGVYGTVRSAHKTGSDQKQSNIFILQGAVNTIPLSKDAPAPITGIYLYPNPTSDNIFISGEHGLQDFSVTNAFGSNIMVEFDAADNKLMTDHLPSGGYFIQMRSGPQIKTFRFVKL